VLGDELAHQRALEVLAAVFPDAEVLSDEGIGATPVPRLNETPAAPSALAQVGPCARCGRRIERYGDRGRPLCGSCAERRVGYVTPPS
jgi:hypothetical protein